ncbi:MULTISPECIES: DUF397 domain-containing protein [Streptomyces]|uniref:DUF397 domain-containing protein n=1 Tax=Streptomyces evansiae TaxID=3075535 RepID=A0ABU2QZJ7_9ACTN|nr:MULTISPECIES: DUF397 domain-containing protein [unclassified Streptomyces]MDT0409871.1 DUF397 domain-containing protein [Streptomyces sp. DSM 41979]MYQ60066.1 DUF397 domain-containing protein [Streptomyces sp. SID4926]SCD98534.1 protein of unknown function [Streptomyces sp. DfronAA-171]
MTSASSLSVEWQKSSYSTNGGNCVEMGRSVDLRESVPVRDSKAPTGPALMFGNTAWASFIAAVPSHD